MQNPIDQYLALVESTPDARYVGLHYAYGLMDKESGSVIREFFNRAAAYERQQQGKAAA